MHNKKWIDKRCSRCDGQVKAFSTLCVECQKILPPCKHCGSIACGDIYGCCMSCAGSPRGSAHAN